MRTELTDRPVSEMPATSALDGPAAPPPAAEAGAPSRPRWLYPWALVVLLTGLVATAALTLASASLNSSNEHRLLTLRTREVSGVITAVVPSIQTPLGAVAALADATGGDPARFRRFAATEVGAPNRAPFISMSLWRASGPQRAPLALAGVPPKLAPGLADLSSFFASAARRRGLTVIGLLGGANTRIGYAFSGPTSGPFIAYGEAALAPSRFSPVMAGGPFADLNFALYLGPSTRRADLLAATVRTLPFTGRVGRTTVPLGNTVVTILVSPRRPLGGSLPQALPWVIAVVGLLLTLGASTLTVRLLNGRRRAEQLADRLEEVADENQRLYAEQRGIAQTLQRSLLPDVLPELPGVEVGARFEAGVRGIEIGGDWYDLIGLDERRLLLVVGDVSGRGLRAATAMAALRFAIHAFISQGDPPERFLPKLSTIRRLRTSGELATVLCAVIDLERHEVSVTSAGHLPLLLVSNGSSTFLQPKVGLPVGVDGAASYEARTFPLPEAGTLLGFTDGLVERRGEVIDDGLERLRCAVLGHHSTLEELVTRVVDEVRGPGSEDDTAIAGVRWTS